MDKKVRFRTIKEWEDNFHGLGGVSIHNPLFRRMEPEEIIQEANLAEYAEIGYNDFAYCQSTATVYCYQVNNLKKLML